MRWKTLLMLLLPAAAALVVYLNTLDAGFVHDDHLQIEDNPWVKQLRHLPTAVSNPVWRFRTVAPTNYYRPVQMALYNLLWAASGGDPLPFHLANILLHVMATTAVTLLVWRLSGNRLVASGAALLFAVHPVNTETVAWVACLPELGYSLCVLVALLLHFASWRPSWGGLRGPALLAALLAMLFKETGLTVIPLVFLLELWVRPTSRAGGGSGSTRMAALLTAARASLPYAAVAIAYFALRFAALGGVAPKARSELTALDALLNAPVLFFDYIGTLLLPARLLAFHPFEPLPSATHPAVLIGLPALLLVPVLLVFLARRRPDLAFAGALVCLPLLPVLYVPVLGASVFAERYAYLPSAGLAWIVVAAVAAGSARLVGAGRGAALALIAAALLALPLGLRSVERNEVWHDDGTMARSVLELEPGAGVMTVVLGNWYVRQGRLDEAVAAYEKGLAFQPDYIVLRVNYVGLLMRMGRIGPDEAIAQFEQMAESNPLSFEAHAMIGDAHLAARRFDEAEAAYLRALEANPRDALLHNRLAVIYVETGRVEEARRRLLEALALDPDLKPARENLRHLDRLREPLTEPD
jgi:tetratricopeptide (TPR) repeat protein